MNKTKEKPAHEIRLGRIKAAIWRNTASTDIHYNVTFSRIYRDGDAWKSAESFGRDDLLVVAKIADLAHSWIHSQVVEPDRVQNN